MNIGLIDLIIIIMLLLGGIVGFKEGVIKKVTSFIGLFVVIILAFMLKNRLSVLFYENLPFFDLWGVFKGVQVLNVILYELIAFIVIASVLMLVYHVLLMVTGLIEKVLKATVILSIPSKLLGFVVGVIESYVWIYIILFILTLPIVNVKEVYTSKIANYMLSNTPILSKYTDDTVEIYQDIYKAESAEKLIKSNKISVSDDYKVVKEGKEKNEDNSLDEWKSV